MEADTIDAATFGERKTIVTTTATMASVPALTLIASDGTEITSGGKLQLHLSSGGKSLTIGVKRGFIISVR